MPQFDPTTFVSQIFWLFISFTILYLVVAHFAIPRFRNILEQRARGIQADLDRAESLKSEAENTLENYEAAMVAAHNQARTLILKVQQEAKTEAAETNRVLAVELNAQILEAEQRIAKARDDAMKSLSTIAAEAAQEAVERIAGLDVSKNDADVAVNSAIEGSD